MTKLILIDSSFGLIRTAISQGGKLLDYYEESPDQGRSKGNIYKGLVKKVEDHIQAAFVRYMDRPQGDVERAVRTVERTLDLLEGWTDLNEFKHTSIPR